MNPSSQTYVQTVYSEFSPSSSKVRQLLVKGITFSKSRNCIKTIQRRSSPLATAFQTCMQSQCTQHCESCNVSSIPQKKHSREYDSEDEFTTPVVTKKSRMSLKKQSPQNGQRETPPKINLLANHVLNGGVDHSVQQCTSVQKQHEATILSEVECCSQQSSRLDSVSIADKTSNVSVNGCIRSAPAVSLIREMCETFIVESFVIQKFVFSSEQNDVCPDGSWFINEFNIDFNVQPNSQQDVQHVLNSQYSNITPVQEDSGVQCLPENLISESNANEDAVSSNNVSPVDSLDEELNRICDFISNHRDEMHESPLAQAASEYFRMLTQQNMSNSSQETVERSQLLNTVEDTNKVIQLDKVEICPFAERNQQTEALDSSDGQLYPPARLISQNTVNNVERTLAEDNGSPTQNVGGGSESDEAQIRKEMVKLDGEVAKLIERKRELTEQLHQIYQIEFRKTVDTAYKEYENIVQNAKLTLEKKILELDI